MSRPDALAAWLEWKARCALGLCDAPAQDVLREFAHSRFLTHVRRYAYRTGVSSPADIAVRAREAWHLFETRLTVTATAQGKRYKDWLFARAEHSPDAPLDVIQGGATLVMRDVVRAYLRDEITPAATISLDAPLGDDGAGGLTMADLLPGDVDAGDEVCRREYQRLAVEQAALHLAAAGEREKVAVLAWEQGLSLAHPAVQAAADCGATQVNAAYHRFMRGIGDRLRARYPGEDREALARLAILVVDEVRVRIVEWGQEQKKAKNHFAALFQV